MGTIIRALELSPAYFYTVIGVFGLMVGSFLNVAAIRIPLGLSVCYPPSRCDSCGHRLGPLDLIPVLGFFLARGKCKYCGESFSIRYALWEAAAGLLFVLTAAVLGPVPELIPGLLLVSLLIPIVQTDLRHMIIPNKIVFFGFVSGALVRLAIHPEPLWTYAAAFVAGGGVLYAAALVGERLLRKESMGGGDIKLLAMLGLFMGIKGVMLALFLGCLAGLLVNLLLMALGLVRSGQPVPFGPYLALGALPAYLWGGRLLDWYTGILL